MLCSNFVFSVDKLLVAGIISHRTWLLKTIAHALRTVSVLTETRSHLCKCVNFMSHRQKISTLVPVLNGIKGILVGDVIHQNEAHCSTIVCCGDGPVPLLPSSVLKYTQVGVKMSCWFFQLNTLYSNTKLKILAERKSENDKELLLTHIWSFILLSFR